jgi:hypothetical protein
MGTTLTGTTPQDTYDSLIKVTDNGPLSGSLKKLTDGLGNDSALSLSTGAIQLTGTNSTAANNTTTGFSADLYAMAVRQRGASAGISGSNFTAQLISAIGAEGFEIYTPNAKELVLGTNALERMRITSAGNVGIGTSTPASNLEVYNSSTSATLTLNGIASTEGAILNFKNRAAKQFSANRNIVQIDNYLYNDASETTGGMTRIKSGHTGSGVNSSFISFSTSPNDGNLTERVRVTNDGLTFNGDTAAANALDDYEEGTWTMGVSFGGASTGVAYLNNTGTYTKIGRQVTVNGVLTLTSKGSSTGVAAITGLPFTVVNTNSNYAATSLRFYNISFTNQFQAYGERNSTRIDLEEITALGTVTRITDADFQNSSEIIVSFTYFV